VELPPITPEVILWLMGPPLASIGVALGAFFAPRRAVRWALFLTAVGGLVVSALWILLALRVEAIEKRSVEEKLRSSQPYFARLRFSTEDAPGKNRTCARGLGNRCSIH
jgi:hypothetical protein